MNNMDYMLIWLLINATTSMATQVLKSAFAQSSAAYIWNSKALPCYVFIELLPDIYEDGTLVAWSR